MKSNHQIKGPRGQTLHLSAFKFQVRFASMIKWWICLSLATLAATGCSPKIYVIDRQTVLEEEAAGEWPQFEKAIMQKSATGEATPFETVPVNARKRRLYNVLNGELTADASKTIPQPKNEAVPQKKQSQSKQPQANHQQTSETKP